MMLPIEPYLIEFVERMQREGSPADQRLHAFATPEAFAIDERPQALPLRGLTPRGEIYDGVVRVPHPFASLCMKIKAAADFEHAPVADRKPRGQKHAQDVYLLLAMLSEEEWDQSHELRVRFGDHPELQSIRAAVTEFFAGPEQPGCFTIRRTTNDADIDRFSQLIRELFA